MRCGTYFWSSRIKFLALLDVFRFRLFIIRTLPQDDFVFASSSDFMVSRVWICDMLKTKIILAMWRGTYFWSLDQIFGIAGPCFWTHIIFIRTTFYGCFTFLAGYSLKNFGVLWFENSRCFSDFLKPKCFFYWIFYLLMVTSFFGWLWLVWRFGSYFFCFIGCALKPKTFIVRDSWPVSDFTDTSEFQRHFSTWFHFITTLASRITVL